MLERVKRQSVAEQAFIQLRDRLASGDWKPGDKLPSENELAAAMGVSRVTVRAAISRLTALGLVETRSGEGSFVRERALGEVLEYRKIIEGPTAALACIKANDEDIAELEGIYLRMELEKDNRSEFSRADFDFHRALGRITGNSLITETYGVLESILVCAMEKIVERRGNAHGLFYHKSLLEAMKSRNPEACRLIMNEHIEDTYANVITYHLTKEEN